MGVCYIQLTALVSVFTFVCGSAALWAEIGLSISSRKLSTFPQLNRDKHKTTRNQRNNKSTINNQSINQSVGQSVSQSINQLLGRSVGQSAVNQPVSNHYGHFRILN